MSTNSALAPIPTFLKIKRFQLVLLCILSLTLFLLPQGQVLAGQASLSWEAPATNEDGTSLTDLNGYKIYYGTAPGNYTQNIDVGNVTTYTFTNLTDGRHTIYCFYQHIMPQESKAVTPTKSLIIISSSTQTYTLSVNKAGSGVITSSPAGISCGADCTEVYTAGTVVTLTAAPDGNSSFAGWSGACTGSGTCTVTMDAAKSVTATFALKTYTITASAGTGGSISPNGTTSVNHSANQSFTITATIQATVLPMYLWTALLSGLLPHMHSPTSQQLTQSAQAFLLFLILLQSVKRVPAAAR